MTSMPLMFACSLIVICSFIVLFYVLCFIACSNKWNATKGVCYFDANRAFKSILFWFNSGHFINMSKSSGVIWSDTHILFSTIRKNRNWKNVSKLFFFSWCECNLCIKDSLFHSFIFLVLMKTYFPVFFFFFYMKVCIWDFTLLLQLLCPSNTWTVFGFWPIGWTHNTLN